MQLVQWIAGKKPDEYHFGMVFIRLFPLFRVKDCVAVILSLPIPPYTRPEKRRASDNLLYVCFGLDFIHLSLDIRQDCSL